MTNIATHPDNPVFSSVNGVLFNREKTKIICYPHGLQGDYVIPDSTVEIGRCSFNGCKNLTSVFFPDSVIKIEDHAFSYCTGLTFLNLPDSNVEIDDHAFYGCTGLKSVFIPKSVTKMNCRAFHNSIDFKIHPDNCSFIVENGILFNSDKTELLRYPEDRQGDYIIPDSVIKIGSKAFSCCHSLTSIIIPESVVEIDESAFWYCTGLTSVIIPCSVTKIVSNAFQGCERLKSVIIPDSVVVIEDCAFADCYNLTSLDIPKTVVEIGDWAFEHSPTRFRVHLDNPVYAVDDMGYLIEKKIKEYQTT